MDREQLLKRIDREWQGFVRAAKGLPEEVFHEPGVVGDWSVKDLMGHVATWEEEAVAALGVIMRGGRVPLYAAYGGIDAFNDRKWREHRELPLEQVRRRFLESHRRLVDFLADVPEAHFATETRFRRRLRIDTYGHYPEHRKQILSWRESRGV